MSWHVRAFAALGSLAVAASACGDSGATSSSGVGAGAPRWVDDVEAPLPETLGEVGLFTRVATRSPAADVVAYVPRYPLYSDALDKERLLRLPEGTHIDAASEAWTFPVGTVLAKTFVEGGAPIETRLLFRRAEAWDYALYAWRSDGSEADLLPGNWAERSVALPSGAPHVLPARLDCRTCHETSESVEGHPVLGVSRYQVDDALAQAPVFDGPALRAEIAGATPSETAALGYFVGNCTSCHNGGEAINASFSLLPEVAVANTVGVPTEAETGEGIRVVAGDPEASVLFIGVVRAPAPDYAGPFKAMPPLGLSSIDPSVEALLRDWIEAL